MNNTNTFSEVISHLKLWLSHIPFLVFSRHKIQFGAESYSTTVQWLEMFVGICHTKDGLRMRIYDVQKLNLQKWRATCTSLSECNLYQECWRYMSEYSNTAAKNRAQKFFSPQELIKIPVSLDIESSASCWIQGWALFIVCLVTVMSVLSETALLGATLRTDCFSVMWAERCLCTDNVLIVVMRIL